MPVGRADLHRPGVGEQDTVEILLSESGNRIEAVLINGAPIKGAIDIHVSEIATPEHIPFYHEMQYGGPDYEYNRRLVVTLHDFQVNMATSPEALS